MGFDPYAFELANLVREGYLDRESALERLDREENPEVLDMVRSRLSAAAPG